MKGEKSKSQIPGREKEFVIFLREENGF